MYDLLQHTDIADIGDKVLAGERLDFDDGVRLFRTPYINAVGWLAHQVRTRLHDDRVYFVSNRQINPTNMCVYHCTFCAFAREARTQEGAYEMTLDEVVAKAEVLQDAHELHIVGGMHPDWKFEHYLDILRVLHERFPQMPLKAYTAVEIARCADISGLTERQVLERMIEVGLSSLPGGGAEVFHPEVRQKLCPEKADADRWLRIHRTAHELGLRSNATLLYGHIETAEHRVDHMLRLRALQDETGGFFAFIPLAYHRDGNPLQKKVEGLETTGFEDLRTIAVGRLMLDNFPHIKSYWIMLGLHMAQTGLRYGASDMDGTVIEERITHAAGAKTPEVLSVDELVRLIREAGMRPIQRDALYNIVREWDAAPAVAHA